jgi:hypothetical protein
MSYNLLSQNAFWITNKKLAKEFGIECALLLSDLITKYEYYKSKGELKEHNGDYCFYYTSEDIEKNTTLSYHKQKSCIAKLIKAGFIEVIRIGIPGTLHFKIFENNISNFLNCGVEENQNVYNKNKDIKIDNNISNNVEKIDFEFDRFWKLYAKSADKKTCQKLWGKISKADKAKIFETLPVYIKSTPDKQFRKNPGTYLRHRGWEDEIINKGGVVDFAKSKNSSSTIKDYEYNVNEIWGR